MTNTTKKILFGLIPVFAILLFVTSGETIPSFLTNTISEDILYLLSFPNAIIFNLCIGYLSGVFIYFLTTYLPEKRRETFQNIITEKLLSELLGIMKSMDNSVLRCSTEKLEDLEGPNKEKYKIICKKCQLNTPTGAKKLISDSPLVLGNLTIKESLLNDWNKLLKTMNKIDFASIYISPDLYDYCQSIRNSNLSLTIDILSKNIRNIDLEAFSDSLFDLRQMSKELQKKIDRIPKKRMPTRG